MTSKTKIKSVIPIAKTTPHGFDAGLQIEGVSKRFGSTFAVKNIFLSAQCGEVHALLGENGAGKSTLMAIASGSLRPDTGNVSIGGQKFYNLTVSQAQTLGLAIVHQHPAILPDLTIRENILLAVPAHLRDGTEDENAWVELQLKRMGARLNPATFARNLDVVQLQLIELAKAFAIEPRVLILDEPTAALTSELSAILFENIRQARNCGAAIIYISHRLKEVRQIADTVTIIRDGETQITSGISSITDDEILRFIVGRTVSKIFPAKGKPLALGQEIFSARAVSGTHFRDVTMNVASGEIVGLAGIAGNGQNEFLRAIAGLEDGHGSIVLGSETLEFGRPNKAREKRIVFLSSDRPNEGAFLRQSVRENASIAALHRLSRLGFINRKHERLQVELKREELNIKTATIEQPISALSGGNQQKVILARALLAHPKLVLAEEPTAGVDVGARAEIYEILRDLAASGTPIIVVSSDLIELEGLCDRVYVFSRGHIVQEVTGAEVNEEVIARAMVTSSVERDEVPKEIGAFGGVRTLLANTYAPAIVLAFLIIGLSLFVASENARFLSAFNVEKILFLSSALGFIAFGQLCAILTARIDLSVGPLVGLVVVIASFQFSENVNTIGILIGILAIIGAAGIVGLLNGYLVWLGKLPAVAATLGVSILIQGTSVLLRPFPDGKIGSATMSAIKSKIAFVPTAFVLVVFCMLVLECILRNTRTGIGLRAVGSNETAATHIGVSTGWMVLGAFVASSILTALGAFIVVGQLGIGDANQGVEYTLSSIAAVVLSGASIKGGQGSFLGVLLGAILIQVINSSMVFLGFSQAWQFWFIGLLTLGAVAVYSRVENLAR